MIITQDTLCFVVVFFSLSLSLLWQLSDKTRRFTSMIIMQGNQQALWPLSSYRALGVIAIVIWPLSSYRALGVIAIVIWP